MLRMYATWEPLTPDPLKCTSKVCDYVFNRRFICRWLVASDTEKITTTTDDQLQFSAVSARHCRHQTQPRPCNERQDERKTGRETKRKNEERTRLLSLVVVVAAVVTVVVVTVVVAIVAIVAIVAVCRLTSMSSWFATAAAVVVVVVCRCRCRLSSWFVVVVVGVCEVIRRCCHCD